MGSRARERNRRRVKRNADPDGRRREDTKAKRRARCRYWLTPRAWDKRCSHCGRICAIAYRPDDGKHACVSCIERLGIKAGESKAWRDGGSRAGSAVTIRHVDPESLRPPTPPPES